MKNILIILLVLMGVICAVSILLMSPKGGLGFGIGGAGGSNEYGSKKSIEHTLKKVATVAGIIFIALAVAIPYV